MAFRGLDPNTEEFWTSLYSAQIDGLTVGFERAAKQVLMGDDPEMLREALSIEHGQVVVLIGAGFGWIAEEWAEKGIVAVAVDTSAWIQQNLEGNALVEVVADDCQTETGRQEILSRLQRSPDWVISEDVLPVLSDEECLALRQGMAQLGGYVAHWVSVGTASGDPRLNWKTLEEWKALMTPDLVIQRGTATVL